MSINIVIILFRLLKNKIVSILIVAYKVVHQESYCIYECIPMPVRALSPILDFSQRNPVNSQVSIFIYT